MNALRDDRYSFETSTVAAAKHLARLKKDFGDDALAISAYNVGEGALNTMIKVQNTRNFFDLYLNEETASYFFRILAIKYAFEHPDTFGIPQHLFEHSFQETPYTEQEFADIPDLAELCKTLGVSYKQVRALNPWILTDELKQGPWKLKIPKNKKS